MSAAAMKHPARSDFETAVTEAGVTVTFKPTNSIYSFYRLAESEDIARLGPVSPERARHAGSSGDTNDYPSDEVQDMAQRIASEVAASVWLVQDEKEADKLTLRGHSIGGDDDASPKGFPSPRTLACSIGGKLGFVHRAFACPTNSRWIRPPRRHPCTWRTNQLEQCRVSLDLPPRQTPLLPDKPVLTDPTFDLEQLQLQSRPLRAASTTGQRR
jgi:hypothetical protein